MVAKSSMLWIQSWEKTPMLSLYMSASLMLAKVLFRLTEQYVRRAFESHWKPCMFVLVKWCNDGTEILTLIVKLEVTVMHRNIVFSENRVPEHLRKMSIMIGLGILLTFYKFILNCWSSINDHLFRVYWKKLKPIHSPLLEFANQYEWGDPVLIYRWLSAHKELDKNINVWVEYWVSTQCEAFCMGRWKEFH